MDLIQQKGGAGRQSYPPAGAVYWRHKSGREGQDETLAVSYTPGMCLLVLLPVGLSGGICRSPVCFL